MFFPSPHNLFNNDLPVGFSIVDNRELRKSFQSQSIPPILYKIKSLVMDTPLGDIVLLNLIETEFENTHTITESTRFWKQYANWLVSAVLMDTIHERKLLRIWYTVIKLNSVNGFETKHFSEVVSFATPDRVLELDLELGEKFSLILSLGDSIERYTDDELYYMGGIPRAFLEKLLDVPSSSFPKDMWMLIE